MDIPLPPSPPRPATPAKPASPVEYSPSHVTMSDDDDMEPQQIMEKIKKIETNKKVENAGDVVTPISPPKAISIDLKRNPKVLGGNRAVKLLNAFKVTKAGTISLDMAKAASRSKISKLKNFDDDENEQERKMAPLPPQTIVPPTPKEKEVKKPEAKKLNIESIIKEENAVKIKHYYPAAVPQLPILGMPGAEETVAAEAAAARVEANLLSGVMATKFDNMGFVTSVSAQKFLEEQKKSKKEENSKRRRSTSRDRRSRSRDRRSRSRDRRSRSRDRRSRSRDKRGRDHRSRSRERRGSRSRSRERHNRSKTPQTTVQVDIPPDLKEMPSSWKETKEKQLDVTKETFVRIKAALASTSGAPVEDKDSAAKKRLKTLVRKRGEPRDWLDPYANECEKALSESTERSRLKQDQVDKEYKYTEFPIGGVKRTTCRPTLEWSMNPKFCTSYLSRKDCLEENADYVQKILKAEAKTASAKEIFKRPSIFVREDSFLDPTMISEPVFENVQVMEDNEVNKPEEEMAVEEEPEQKDKKKKKKKDKKKSKEGGDMGEKPKKDKSKKKKKKKDKKDDDDFPENEIKESSKSSRKSKRKRSEDEQRDGEELMVEGEMTTGQKKKREETDQLTENVQTKKEKKKKRKKHFDDSDVVGGDASPLQDEHTPLAAPIEEIVQGSGLQGLALANIGTWEDPMKSAGRDLEPENADNINSNPASKSSASNVVDKLLNIAGYTSSTSEGRDDRRRRLSSRELERDREGQPTDTNVDREIDRRRHFRDEEERRFSSRHELDDPDYEREDMRRHDERMLREGGRTSREGGRVARLSRDEESRVARQSREEDGRVVRPSREEEGRVARVSRDEEGRIARPPRDDEGRVARVSRDEEGRIARPPRDDEGRVARVSRDEEGRIARPPRDDEGRVARVSRDEEGRIARPPRDDEGRVARQPRDDEGRVARSLRDEEGRIARQLRDEEGRVARSSRDEEGRVARPLREEEGRVARPLRDEEGRYARPSREDENRIARSLRDEEGRVSRPSREDESRVARPSREDESRVTRPLREDETRIARISERRELSREEDVRSPSFSRRSTGQTPPSDPRLKRFRSGPRTPSRSPPPPISGSRHRQGPRTPSPTMGDARRPSRQPPRSPHASISPKHRHEYEERRGYLPSPRRYGSPPRDEPEHWHPADVRSPRYGRPPSPGAEHRRPTSTGRERLRRSTSPRYRYGRGYSPSFRPRGSPPPGERRRSRTPPNRDGYHRRRGSPISPPGRRSPMSPGRVRRSPISPGRIRRSPLSPGRGRRSPLSPGRGRRSPISPSRHQSRHDYPMASHPPDYYHPEHDFRSTLVGPPGLNSPKRLPLDERLEKELGIKVHDELAPDYSRPPPGYPFSGTAVRTGPQDSAHLPASQSIPAQVITPPFQTPPAQRIKPEAHGLYPGTVQNVQAVSNLAADPPVGSRLVCIGNMLQIVTEPTSAYVAPIVPAPTPISVRSSVPEDSGQAKEFMRKMEEMKLKKEEEQRLKREKRILDRLSSKQQLDQLQTFESEPLDSRSSERILETIEKEEEEDLEAQEARLLEEAISSVPEMDDEEEVRDPITSMMHQEDVQSIIFSDKNRRRSKSSGAEVRYISLKPLARKERRRQQRLMTQIEDEEEAADDHHVPRSPVPLPDVSTCKPILVQLGFSLSARAKKSLRYADGVVPGQGSPDHVEEKDEDDDDISPPPAPAEPKPKRRKKVVLKVIQQKTGSTENSDSDDGQIPGPPPGSPPLHHTQQLIEMFGIKQPLTAASSLVAVL